jgi:hypothetical protein
MTDGPVTLDFYPTEAEADVVLGLLEASGIEARLIREMGPEAIPVGPVGVQVAAEDERAARDVIASAQLEEATEIGEDLDEMGEDEE